MNTLRARILIGIMWVTAILAVVFISYNYFTFMNERVKDEGARTLSEVYNQINNNFDAYIERNWKNLDDWYSYFITMDSDKEISDFIQSRKKLWTFSQFFFINRDGAYRTASGVDGQFEMGDELDHLYVERHRIMHSENIDGHGMVTLFAFPVAPGTYQDFAYTAIGITYTNEDMIASLKTDAFQGESTCFIVRPNGQVILSTQPGGNVFGNYINFLEGASNLNASDIEKLQDAWVANDEGFVSCNLGNTPTYIYYEPINYRKFTLLGVVPQAAANGSLLEIQGATIDVTTKIFGILLIAVAVQFFLRYRKSARTAATEIRTRDQLFSMLSSNVNDVFILLDGETWHVDYVSPNIKRLLGISVEEVAENIHALSSCRVCQDKNFTHEQLAKLPFNESVFFEEAQRNLDTGEERWFNETIYRENLNGRVKYVIVMSDRTEERKLNDNLQEALDTAKNANRAKSFFLSNMSHDIRTPMNAIIGFTELISANVNDPQKVTEYTRKITSSSKHLLSLINDVLDMSKIESGKTALNIDQFSLYEMKEELYTICSPQAEARHQTIEFKMDGQLPQFVLGDKLRISQILINLLSNAVKYTPDGGEVTFTIKDMPNETPSMENIRFIVRDNGAGMSADFLEKLFDPFTRETSSLTNVVQGTGLGMAITKNLIDLMGGVINVESEPGKGTTVVVDMSFALPEFIPDETFWETRGIKRLLVVDDEERICEEIVAEMADSTVQVDYVLDGQSAIDRVEQAASTDDPYSLVLLDWKMPGLTGVETARIIHERVSADIPILVLTSYDWSDIVDEARAAGIDAFLAKPFFLTSLQRTVALMQADKLRDDDVHIDENILTGMNILAAEDNALSAEMLADILDLEDANVDIVGNGQLAVDKFVDSAPETYDFILMDVQMPVMGGYDATRAIRASNHPQAKSIPIFAMTANVFAEDVKDAMEAGMTEHLPKPIDMAKLKLLVDRFVRGEHS